MLFGLFSRKHIRTLDDSELVKLVKDNDKDALGEIFQRYSPLVMGLCLKYMKSVPVAEDIMMEMFEKLPQKIAKAEIGNFKNWLYTVSRNECLMDLRKKKLDTGDLENAEIFTANEDEERLQAAYKKEEELKALEVAISGLKDEQRVCIDLFYLKRKSYEEITRQTGFELKKVKSYIQNGKRNIKLTIEEQK